MSPDVKGGLAVEKRGRVWRVLTPVRINDLGLDHGPFLRKREAQAYREVVLDRVGGDFDREVGRKHASWLFALSRTPALVEARRSRHGRSCEACGAHADHGDGPCGPREGAGPFIPPEFRTWVG
ncbi:hypothetical protein [Frankia sp. CcI49]|uniref:hypothetical protein n=1 Tax=Frankia sp. CcI49 TaxID=1745382 RepID=UPI001055F969|nr:hypothetical protein [Frankia sp. CcI49]